MDYEITHWKVPNDFHKVMQGLDVMVAIMAKRPGTELYLYNEDYKKIARLAKSNLPGGATLGQILFRGIVVNNGGSKKSKRPAPAYTPPTKRAMR